jgi:hypothetical protein
MLNQKQDNKEEMVTHQTTDLELDAAQEPVSIDCSPRLNSPDKRNKDVELMGRLMADMDPELLAFLREKLDSFIKWDLIHFFCHNPHTTDTPENIARYTGRNVELVQQELADLANREVLTRRRLGDMIIYSLTNDVLMRNLVRRFVEASEDRQFRAKAIYYVIRGMR